jgi:hypothetical protein
MSRPCAGLVVVLVLTGGCLPMPTLDPGGKEGGTTAVPTSPFGSPPPPAPTRIPASYAPASAEVALRVDKLGREICAANPQAALKPRFAIYSAPRPEIFHQGTKIVHVTDSLVRACKSDGALAAVLCVEFAKMVAEREALVRPIQHPDEPPPMQVSIGNAGQVGAVDQARLVELARYEQRRRAASRAVPPPDPQILAGTLLEKAGYSRAELETVRPLLRTAEGNYVLEKQFRSTSGAGGWVPGS